MQTQTQRAIVLKLRAKNDLPPSAHLQLKKGNVIYENTNNINASIPNESDPSILSISPLAPFKFNSSADYLLYKTTERRKMKK